MRLKYISLDPEERDKVQRIFHYSSKVVPKLAEVSGLKGMSSNPQTKAAFAQYPASASHTILLQWLL